MMLPTGIRDCYMSGAPWSVMEVFDDVDDKLHALTCSSMKFSIVTLRLDQLKFVENQIPA